MQFILPRSIRLIILLGFSAIICLTWVGTFDAQAQQPGTRAAIPLGLPADTYEYFVPRHNPLTAAKVELGRKLFFDERLSADGKVACATCHKPERAFADEKPLAEGISGKRGPRNSPSLLNAMYANGQFWDGRADTLEQQAIQPLTNPIEMGAQTHEQIVTRLRQLPDYVSAFEQAFRAPLTIERVGDALAAFERTLLSGNSPYDHYQAGDKAALSPAALRGLALFRGKARCSRCHTFSEQRPLFSNYDYLNTGIAARHPQFEKMARELYALSDDSAAFKALADKFSQQPGGAELGRAAISYHYLDLGAFRVPGLRNVALTAPYFHDGSAATLLDVVKFYNEGGKDNINREWEMHSLDLSDEEMAELVTFMESLTGKPPEAAKLAAK